jgi:hypothetical protein
MRDGKIAISSVLILSALCSITQAPHRWNQQWMAPTLAALMGLTRAKLISM